MNSESIAFIQDTDNENEAIKKDSIGAAGIAVALTVSGLLVNLAALAADEPKIVHDAEHYILDAQYGEKWAMEDKQLDQKLANLRKKLGTPRRADRCANSAGR